MAKNGITQIRNITSQAGESAPTLATVNNSGYRVPANASSLVFYANAISTTGAPTSLNIDVWVAAAGQVWKLATLTATISSNAGSLTPTKVTDIPYSAVVYPTVSFVGGTSPTATLRVGVQPLE